MNKIKRAIFSFFLLGASIACENSELKKVVDYTNVIASLDQIHKNAFDVALSSDLKSLYANTFNYLKESYSAGGFTMDLTSFKQSNSGRTSYIELDLSFLTNQQKAYASPFLQQIMLVDDATLVNGIVNSFEQQVLASPMGEERRYQLLSMGSLIREGAQTIMDAQASQPPIEARYGGRIAKTIDVRGALRAGIISLTFGAVGGAKIGCAGGTVVFPGLGTATGCVGGAVLGGAMGFIGGVATSILQDLLFD